MSIILCIMHNIVFADLAGCWLSIFILRGCYNYVLLNGLKTSLLEN